MQEQDLPKQNINGLNLILVIAGLVILLIIPTYIAIMVSKGDGEAISNIPLFGVVLLAVIGISLTIHGMGRIFNKSALVYKVWLVIVSAIFIFSLYQSIKMREDRMEIIQGAFSEEKDMLRDELDDIIDEHDDLLDEYGDLNEQLHEKDSVIQQQIAEIRNLIRTKSDLKEARRKIEMLKSISKKYIANIDSLLVLNEQLSNEKDSVISVNKDINWRNYKLNKQNEQLSKTVSKGSVLKLENIEVEAIKYKSTGREVSTKQAKKTQKIRVCFSVLANPIAKTEAKTVYLQLIDNNGIVITGNKDVSISISDNPVICTDSSEFNYANIEMTHCFEWERVHMLAAGYYLVNLIIDEKVALQSMLKLK